MEAGRGASEFQPPQEVWLGRTDGDAVMIGTLQLGVKGALV